MEAFEHLVAVAAPLPVAKIDTGMILPGRYMRRHRKPGSNYADAFLHDLRFDEHDQPRPEFRSTSPPTAAGASSSPMPISVVGRPARGRPMQSWISACAP